MFTMRPPQHMLPTRKRLSTSSFSTTLKPPLGQSYGVDLSTPFLSMDPSNTSHQMPRTLKSPSTSWPNTSRTNKSMVARLTILLISMAWVMPSGISFLWSMRLNRTLYTLIRKLTHLEQKSRRNSLQDQSLPTTATKKKLRNHPQLLSTKSHLPCLFLPKQRRKSMSYPNTFIPGNLWSKTMVKATTLNQVNRMPKHPNLQLAHRKF